jgi:hypothetical protein
MSVPSEQSNDPYESDAEASLMEHETRSRNIQSWTVATLLDLRRGLLLARRRVGLRPLPGRVVSAARPGPLCAARRHDDERGFTVTARHPQSPSDFRLEVLSVRWGARGRGVHLNRWGFWTALDLCSTPGCEFQPGHKGEHPCGRQLRCP